MAAAVATEFLYDVAFSLLRGTDLQLDYLLLCGLLMLAAGIACVALAVLFPGSALRSALVLYVVAHGVADPLLGWSHWVAAIAMGYACWLYVSPGRVAASTAAMIGVVIATALCVALIHWPFVEQRLGIARSLPWQEPTLRALVFSLVLGCARIWDSLRARVRALPAPAILAAIALAVSLPLAFDRGSAHSIPERPAAAASAAISAPDIFVLILDTVRADRLSTYGYERETAPNLARLLSDHPEAKQYEFAFSTANWTIPAHASLLSGRMPSVHGMSIDNLPQGEDIPSWLTTLAFGSDQTLAETMWNAGYCTTGVIANNLVMLVPDFRRGFDAFFRPTLRRPLRMLGPALMRRFLPAAFAGVMKPHSTADSVNAHVLRSKQACGARPAFVLANYMEAHSPYLPPYPHANLFAGDGHAPLPLEDPTPGDSPELMALKADRYDESIHHLDAELGRLFEEFSRTGALDRSWLFITSDHGEAFREHGANGHGTSIYNEQVRIPLIVKPPRGVALPPDQDAVSLLDVTTTVAAIAGRTGFGSGRDLRLPASQQRFVAVEGYGVPRPDDAEATEPARAAIGAGWKLIQRGERVELYELAGDARESVDRASEQPELLDSLRNQLPAASAPREPGRPPGGAAAQPLGLEDAEALRALGYLD